MTDNENILFDARGFMADPVVRACRPEAVGMLFVLITEYYPDGLRLTGDKWAQRLQRHRTPRGRLAEFAAYLNEQMPTSAPEHTLHGLRELYDRKIILVSTDTITVSPDFDYVVGVE